MQARFHNRTHICVLIVMLCYSSAKASNPKPLFCHPCSSQSPPSSTIGGVSSGPHALFHYSEQASCIVTTTNFLAVYKAVNQNHTEQGVEEGSAGAELGGLWGRATGAGDQMSRKRKELEGGGCVCVSMRQQSERSLLFKFSFIKVMNKRDK